MRGIVIADFVKRTVKFRDNRASPQNFDTAYFACYVCVIEFDVSCAAEGHTGCSI